MIKFNSPTYVKCETLRRDTAEAEQFAEQVRKRVDDSGGNRFELPYADLPRSAGARQVILDQLVADGWSYGHNNFGLGGYAIWPTESASA